MYLTNLKIENVIDAHVEDENIMVVIKTENSGTKTFNEELQSFQSVGHPVEILPKTHKLYNAVVKKFNLTN